jgi:hypothetical protein
MFFNTVLTMVVIIVLAFCICTAAATADLIMAQHSRDLPHLLLYSCKRVLHRRHAFRHQN